MSVDKNVSHNCVDLKKCFNKVEHKDLGKNPKLPTMSVKPKSIVTNESHTKPTKHDVAVTHSSRVIKPTLKEWICK